MKIELIGKFFDNHSLSIINRNLALNLSKTHNIVITPLDSITSEYGVEIDVLSQLKDLMNENTEVPVDVQIRHSYPPIWMWPENPNTKVIYIQPWEFTKVPFEWQYKFETFADALCVPSNYERNVFIQGGMNPNKIFTVPNGYNEDIFNREPSFPFPGVDTKKFVFTYVGNAQWRKGVDILLNAWPVFKKFDNCQLIIKDNPSVYGQNNILNETIKLQYKTDCADILYINDNLSDFDMSLLYKSSDVIVHPYRAEGFGMHIQEAYACGCFPIVPDVGPHKDFLPKEAGLRVKTNKKAININDPGVFATKPGDAMTLMSSHTFYNEPDAAHLRNIMNYLYNHHNRDEYIDKSLEENAEFTWNKVVNKYVQVIEQVGKYHEPRRQTTK
jgi:glycosyltransferase involved in cell wall biosynthesis